jgi:hypothetical protein
VLPKVSVGRRCGALAANIDSYRLLISDGLFDEVAALAWELRGVRICHINSTAFGAGSSRSPWLTPQYTSVTAQKPYGSEAMMNGTDA